MLDKANSPLMQAVNAWKIAQTDAKHAAARELAARAAVVALAFPTPHEGTNNLDLPMGYKLKGMFKNSYTLDHTKVEETLKKLPTAIRGAIVSWKADLKTGAYKQLEPAHKAIVNTILTTKPGTPSLELISPEDE